jgi:UDP-N-acetylmuramoylalanine--D-glutamate ligase
MIRITTFEGRTVAVFGLARSGISTARALIDGGAEVAGWDDTPAAREAAARASIPLVDLASADWSRFAALVLAPGVPLTHPTPHWTVARAKDAGVEVIGDVELFFRERAAHAPGSPVIAITGTNGKSTTTALIAHVLSKLGITVEMGGNIGIGILSLSPPAGDRVHVLELSSFQIDLTPSLAPTVGVLLNVTPDHLDRHGTLEHYASVKRRLVAASDIACIGADDPVSRTIIEDLSGGGRSVYAFTAGRGSGVIPRAYAIGSSLFLHVIEGGYAHSTEIASLAGIGSLRGLHNVQNALAALMAVRALAERWPGHADLWRPGPISAALETYPGLPHRMEQVGTIRTAHGRALVINDSKATNADSTAKALASFPGAIYWIVCGQPKEGGIATLEPYFSRIAKAYLIGEAAEAFAATLDGRAALDVSGTLDIALARALTDVARSEAPEPIVLLSPACASYDQFKSFEHRGDAFRSLALAHGVAPQGATA